MTTTDEKRLKVLNYSLTLEMATSSQLAEIFDRDFKDTKSFGNKSTSLSFNQKMYLLMDFEAIEKDDKVKFDALMNIRNQFLHNQDKTYQYACNAIEGLENKFKKLYQHNFIDEDDIEKSLEKCIDNAVYDCLEILVFMEGGFKTKTENEYQLKEYKCVKDNIDVKFDELVDEISNDKLDLKDKGKLIERILKLQEEIFDISNLINELQAKQDLLVKKMRENEL